jgi:YesN/AraC family two-component response regulator
MYISFTGERSEELFRRFGINAAFRSFDGFESVVPLWQDSLARATDESIGLLAESMLLYAISRLCVDGNMKNDIIGSVISITEESFAESDLSITGIAEELGYNAKYISHLFKEKMGIPYSEYLRNLRIKYAVSLLDHGIDSVKNVAVLSGFQDPLYFSSVFKKVLGISPKEYKKS